MGIKAFICGVGGLTLTEQERDFLRAEQPWGLILFKRNVSDRAQVAALVSELRKCVGNSDAPVLMDQEGGRVQRLQPPEWPAYPRGAVFSRLYDQSPAQGLRAALPQRPADCR